jgi:hypothetical protein
MKKTLGWILVPGFLGAVALALYLWQQGPTWQPPPAASVTPAPPAPPVVAAEPAIRHPLPEAAAEPLPPLEKSDAVTLDALSDVFGKKTVKQIFQPPEIVRRIVVTVDNLPRKVISAQWMPTKPVGGKLRTAGAGEALTLAPSNFERYTPFARIAGLVDAKAFAAAYTRLYPLFQQAYRDLGYPKGYFNDRLVAVIDHLLAAPEHEGPITLIQPHIYYKFADPELESLSAGHKLMLRIGSENAAAIKKKLREIRSELASAPPKGENE